MTQNKINSSKVISQKLTTSRNDVVTCSTAIPNDDTIPQKAEGDEILTLAITPRSATSTLLIEFSAGISRGATTVGLISALFQDATNNALFATDPSGSSCTQLGFIRHVMTSGTTSSTTFKVRVGCDSGSCYVNGDGSGNALMGGTSNSILTITEFL
jgi:hypothetical protein